MKNSYSRFKNLLTLLLGALPIAVQAQATTLSPVPQVAQKIAETPHFWQLDPRGGFKNDGSDYCCPVAVSDSLVYLAHHGFPDLLPLGQGAQPQIDLINLLATPGYLGTDPRKGTAPGTVLSGLEKYVVSKGYQCSTMEYEGWRPVGRGRELFVKADRPDLDWMKAGILNPHGVVWLNIGWYTSTSDGQWKRKGGHWVALVGFDAHDPSALFIDNPGTRDNGDKPGDPAREVVYLRPIGAGTLDTGEGPAQDTSKMYQVSGPGLPIRPGTMAFLDGAIVLVVDKL